MNDSVFHSVLIDTFVNKIYLYDGENGRVEIYCNASEQSINVPIGKLDKSSPMGHLAPPTGIEPIFKS